MRFTDILLNLLYPPKCVSCEEVLDYRDTEALCPLCRARYECEKGFHCPECKKIHAECDCAPKSLQNKISTAIHAVEYVKEESASRDMILHAKDERYEYLYRFLVKELRVLLEGRLDDPSAYLFTFVPRSAQKVAEYGVDQAKEVSKRLAKLYGSECVSLFTHKNVDEQKTLTREARFANTKKSYFLKENRKESVEGKRVILYDDVITTGATLSACVTLLKKAGAKEIVVLTFGKTYLGDQKPKIPIL